MGSFSRAGSTLSSFFLMQPVHLRRTSSLLPCLVVQGESLTKHLSDKPKLSVECLLQSSRTLGLLQEVWFPSPMEQNPTDFLCSTLCFNQTWSMYIIIHRSISMYIYPCTEVCNLYIDIELLYTYISSVLLLLYGWGKGMVYISWTKLTFPCILPL